jgi:hypothetical protein
VVRLALILLVALVASGCGGGDDEASADGATTVALEEANDSGEAGTATLTPTDDRSFTVEIRMKPDSDTAQLAHIHDVTCEEYAELTDFNAQLGSVSHSLNNVKNQRSQTEVPFPLERQTTGKNSINVHNSGGAVVACGDIPER